MPEFGQALSEACIRDWKAYYINYNRLKGWIKEMEEGHRKEASTFYFEELETNLKRVDGFYLAQEGMLEQSIQSLVQVPCHSDKEKRLDPEEAESAQRIVDSIGKLRCFAQMNRDGFRKITKKFDKKVGSGADLDFVPESLQKRMLEVVKTYSFSDADKRLDKLLSVLKDWEEGSEAQPSPTRILSRTSLKVPLLEREAEEVVVKGKARRSAREMMDMFCQFLAENKGVLLISVAILCLAEADLSPKLNGKSYIVIWVTAASLSLLLRQFAADGVLTAATLLLTLCGVLTNGEAWQAFANEVVLSVAGLGVIASVVGETGIIDLVFKALLGKPTSLPVAMLRLILPATCLNLGISNTCVMSCLLPVVDTWSKDIGMHKALFLAPMSYVLLISGTFAIFSTSTNLVAQGLLITHDMPKFNEFDLAVPATLSTIVTIIYLLVATPIVLSRFREVESDAKSPKLSISKRIQNRYDIRVQVVGRQFDGTTLETSGVLEMLSGSTGDVFSCERYGSHLDVSQDLELKLDDILWLRTSLEGIRSLFYAPGLMFLALDLSEDYATLDPSARQLVEAVLDGESPLIGHRIGNARNYRPEYDCSIVAYRAFNMKQGMGERDQQGQDEFLGEIAKHEGKVKPMVRQVSDPQLQRRGSVLKRRGSTFLRSVAESNLPDTEIRLAPGDHIILNVPHSFYSTWKESSDFVVLRKVTTPEQQDGDSNTAAIISGCILLGLIALVASSTLPLLEAVFVAIAALVVTGCTTMDFVVRAVKLRTVLTIVGAFGLGKAIGKEHVAEVLADLLIGALGRFGSRGLLIAVFAATVALGVIFHGTAVVVLMYPICVEASKGMGVPLHRAIAVLCIAVSCQMLSPISYQTNLMAYSTGGYQFADFTKLGAGLVLCIAAVSIPTIEHCFPG